MVLSPVDFNPAPYVWHLVAAFALVHKMTTATGTRREGATSSESEAHLRLHFGSKPRTAATAETTGYARAFRHACDWPHGCRLR